MGEAAYAAIASSGVRVIGDLRALVPAAPSDDDTARPDDAAATIDADTAARLAMGVAWGTGLRLGPKQPIAPRDLPLVFVPTRTLVRLIARRALARLGRTRKLAGLGED
jgi:hypothetical protein